MGRNCRQYFVVEHNGDVYPYDFFVESGLKLGNSLWLDGFRKLAEEIRAERANFRVRERLPPTQGCRRLRSLAVMSNAPVAKRRAEDGSGTSVYSIDPMR